MNLRVFFHTSTRSYSLHILLNIYAGIYWDVVVFENMFIAVISVSLAIQRMCITDLILPTEIRYPFN